MDPGEKAESCVATVIYSVNRTVSRAPRIGHFRNPEYSCSKEFIEGIIQLEHKGTTGAGKASLGKKWLKWQTYRPCQHSESGLATFCIYTSSCMKDYNSVHSTEFPKKYK